MEFECVLFSHVRFDHIDKFANLFRTNEKWLRGLLSENFKRRLLTVFLDHGLDDLLREMTFPISSVEREAYKDELKALFPPLLKASNVGEEVETILGKLVRVITPLDLVDIFGEMQDVANLRRYLVGNDGSLRYDSPKAIEAVVRARLIGSRIPVFRFDQDVLFPTQALDFDASAHGRALRLAVNELVKHVEWHHAHTQVLSTILSGNYCEPDEIDGLSFKDAAEGFALRVNPALMVPAEKPQENKQPFDWNDLATKCYDPECAAKLFKEQENWGATRKAVISGAGLYISDRALLSLPPFSNFTLNVSFVDDHLRYTVHRELGHFCASTVTAGNGNLLTTRAQDARVRKARTLPESFTNFPVWTIKSYLPSLLWGCIMDRWLCYEPLVKLPLSMARTNGKEPEWCQAKLASHKGENRGPLAHAIAQAHAGRIPDLSVLRTKLLADVDPAINTFRMWLGHLDYRLKDGGCSLAYAWIHDECPDWLKTQVNEDSLCRLPKSSKHFQGELKRQLHTLVRDVLEYCVFAYDWPEFVRVINSVRQGEFRSDFGWQP